MKPHYSEWLPTTIRALRENAGLTQEELAEKCGFRSSGTISHFETGVRIPSIESLDKIFTACGVTLTIGVDAVVALDNNYVWVKRSILKELAEIVVRVTPKDAE